MNDPLKSKVFAIVLAGSGFSFPALAANSPYPALPPALSTAVSPNVMLFIDNSGSMRGDKVKTVKEVATNLIKSNQNIRWGIFTFHDYDYLEYCTAGVIQAPVGSTTAQLLDVLASPTLRGTTNTPLGEALFEITRYFDGATSAYGKPTVSQVNQPLGQGNQPDGKNYVSPIQYRCQKNFVILLTDGESTMDDELPGGVACRNPYPLSPFCYRASARPPEPYTSYTYDAASRLYKPVAKKFGVCSGVHTDATTASTPGTAADGVSCPKYLEDSSLGSSAVLHPFLHDEE